jgi:hypothetical protein
MSLPPASADPSAQADPTGPPEQALAGACRASRGLSLALALPAYVLVALGILSMRPWAGPRPEGERTRTCHEVGVVLAEARPQAPPVLVPKADPASTHPEEPAGGGNSLGTGTLDPRLLDLPARAVIDTVPQAVVLPERVTDDVPGRQAPLAIDRSLPPAPGGNGIPKGVGHGYGTGQGDGIGPGRGGGGQPPEDITILVQPHPSYRLQRGDDERELSFPVTIRMYLSADGVPTRVQAVAGPEKLFPECVRAVQLWRYRIPEALRKDAPFRYTITIRPVLARGR